MTPLDLALSHHASPDLLSQLAIYGVADVRAAVAQRTDLPLSVSFILANDPVSDVRLCLAQNDYTPPEVLDVLAMDRCDSVLIAVARHATVETATLRRLIDNPNDWVKCVAVRHPAFPMHEQLLLAEHENVKVREGLGSRTDANSDLLMALAKDHATSVRIAVASHSDLPVQLFPLLAKDRSAQVRSLIASNHRCTLEVLDMLKEDQEFSVRANVAKHPHAMPETLIALAEDSKDLVRSAVASNPSVPPDAIRSLLNDESIQVRVALAQNPSLSSSHYDRLLLDTASVREALLKRADIAIRHLLTLVFDRSFKVRKTAEKRLKSLSDSALSRLVTQPGVLSDRIHVRSTQVRTIGESLLDAGLFREYQVICAAELQVRLHMSLSDQLAPRNPESVLQGPRSML